MEDRAPAPATTILCVEDQASLRKLIEQALAAKGYTVLVAATAAEALEVSNGRPEPIHVLVTDFNLPDLSGSELIRRIRETRPDIKVIVSTGDTETRVERKGGALSGIAFLPKPYTVSDLAMAIRATLTD